MSSPFSHPDLINAVHDRTLLVLADSRLAAHPDDAVVQSVRATCEAIQAQVRDELTRLDALITSAGLAASLSPAGGDVGQIHAVDAHVDSYDTARRIADLAKTIGYQPWSPELSAGAEQSFKRMSRVLTLALPGDVTRVFSVRWSSTSKLHRLPAVLRPNAADWRFVGLPGFLWPLYFLIRPVRLVVERVGLSSTTGEGQLGPFLSTPTSLIDTLFDFSLIESSDHVIDIGCGDGRLVVEAARRRGCRATGIETDADLVAEARRRTADAGLENLVTIIEGDAESDVADDAIGSATVVLLFLPADVTGRLIPELVRRVGAGVRIVAHEQHRIDASVDPETSQVLLAEDSVTVAHLWRGTALS